MTTENIIPKIKVNWELSGKESLEGFDPYVNKYDVRVSYNGKQFSFLWHSSIHMSNMGIEPTKIQLLESMDLDSNIPEDFTEFCEELGYDEDSSRAEKTHKLCLIMAKKINRVFNKDELEQIAEEIHDRD